MKFDVERLRIVILSKVKGKVPSQAPLRVNFRSLNIIEVEGTGAKQLAEWMADEVRREIVRKKAVASGRLLNTIKVVDVSEDKYELRIPMHYIKYLEYGTKPRSKFPPFFPLYTWVVHKFGKSGKEGARIAWAVMTKVKEKGTKPRNIILEAFSKIFGRNMTERMLRRR